MSQMTDLPSYPSRASGATRAMRARFALLRHVLGWPMRVHRARQTMHALGRLGDHELRDIGLTRLDLHSASALPLDADPSALLRREVEARRRGR